MMFVVGTDTFLISPLLPTLRNEFGVSVEMSGWMMGAYALGYALFALVAGPLSDGWNRKKVLVLGMVGFSVSTFLCGIATGFWSMLLFRALAGICAAFASPQVWAIIPSIVPPAKIIKAMGIATAGLAVAQALGMLIGTLLAASSWSIPFFVIGISSLLLSGVAQMVVSDVQPAVHERTTSIFQRYKQLLAQPKAQFSFLAYFIF